MTVSLRLSDQDEKLFKSYAKINGLSVSELIRSAVLEKIEDEYDLATYREAMAEYQANPVSYSHKEMCAMLGIDD